MCVCVCARVRACALFGLRAWGLGLVFFFEALGVLGSGAGSTVQFFWVLP